IITAALRGWSEIEVSATAATLREKARIAEAEMQILTKVQERLDDDLARAQRMQKGILPKPADLQALERSHGIACAAYFEPAHELAGDYWAIRPLDDQSITVILVDFSGHGVTAALNSFLFHSLWLRCPVELENPAASLSHLNRDLHELLPEGILATGMILTIHPERQRIWWSASGWPSAALDHQSEVSWLSGEGPLLGPTESPEFLNYSREFQPEDSLILYSDALIETQDSLTGDLVESIFRTRFQQALRAAKTRPRPEQLPSLIDSCLKNEVRPLRDDLTIVWLRADSGHGLPERNR
ncbi:MAG: PP2C family protein-serine/threonine phosphatase, partial [Alphaproteobacteria bacterium]|nr:PP2C family protein-serine/threonine phosphatase [Alphaproteobacteria bacterium]